MLQCCKEAFSINTEQVAMQNQTTMRSSWGEQEKKKPEKRHVCDTCGKAFQWPAHLQEHKNRVHEGKNFWNIDAYIFNTAVRVFHQFVITQVM